MFPIKNLLPASLLALSVATASADRLDFDFDDDKGNWTVVVDGVMGGRSTGNVTQNEPGVLQFAGELSLENNGGFSQMRCDVSGDKFVGARGIEITVRGDGRTYNFDLRASNARVMAGGFQQAFDTKDGEWTTIRLPFAQFRLYSFGSLVQGAPDLNPALIESVGVTLSDKKEGPFQVEFASIRAFGGETDLDEATKLNFASLSRRSTLERLRELIEAEQAQRTPETQVSMANAEAVGLIELAIARGVPLFNDGQFTACAAVYEVTIEAMIALGNRSLGAAVVERLEQSLVQAKSARNPSDQAWAYRRALDDVYMHLAE